jgi:uncharacterized protein (UPF0332 family)
MNEDHRNDIIKYRIERSKETYREAVLMSRENHWNACANRLYYSCFYAVTALLQKHDMASGKHTGVKSFFNQYFVKTDIVSRENGKLYNRLFDARQEGDYIDFVCYTSEDVSDWIQEVKSFIELIEKLVET